MAHSPRTHKRNWTAAALAPRAPQPGLLDGVGSVVGGAASGVGSVVGDVTALVAPKQSSSATPSSTHSPAPTTASPPAKAPPAVTTTASPETKSSAGSGGSTGGSDNGPNGGSGVPASSSSSAASGTKSPPQGGDKNGSPGSGGSSTNSISASQTAASPAGKPSDPASSGSSVAAAADSPTPVVNAVSEPSTTSATSASTSATFDKEASSSGVHSTATITGLAGSTSGAAANEGPSPDPGSGGGGGVNGSSDASQKSGGLAPGVVAAIAVISALALVAVLLFAARKWHRQRRALRLKHWAEKSTRRGSAFAFLGSGSGSSNNSSNGGGRGEKGGSPTDGSRSNRSSFGTTFDQGLRPFTPEAVPAAPRISPLLEPSASNFTEFYTPRASSVSPGRSTPSSLFTRPTLPHPESAAGAHRRLSDRSSLFSLGSAAAAEKDAGADAGGQYLLVPPLQMNTPGAQQLSPISVGPWSPSERWSFPKPPPASSAGSPPPTSADDPFADPGAAALRRVSASGASSASSDGGATTPSAVTCRTSASAELIKRPFVPTLADELAVRRGDAVHVLQSFDDGWAQVARAHSGETGLIPVDCLREAGEALPAFLAARRVSSCGGAVAL